MAKVIDPAVERFAEAANAYIAWARAEPGDPRNEVVVALGHLARIYGLALKLPDVYGEPDAPDVPADEQQAVHQRFSLLPVGMYGVCFNPQVLPPEAPDVGHIVDDLSDIYTDLRRGQLLHLRGHIDSAAWEWRFHFTVHWGRHAVDALRALHAWLAENPDVLPSNQTVERDAPKAARPSP